MEKRSTLKAAIVFNALVVALEAWAIIHGLTQRGSVVFMFYTSLSNMLGALACIACLIGEIRELRGGPVTSHSIRLLKYAGASCLFMTFCVVVFVLAPMYYSVGMNGFYLLFCLRELPVTHLAGPVLVCVSYVLFEADRTMTLRGSLIGIVPTIMYAAVAYPLNIAQVWHGPYPFFYVWEMPVWQSILWFIALCVLAFALCQLLRLAGRRFSRRID